MNVSIWMEQYPFLTMLLSLLGIFLSAWISFFICRSYLLRIIRFLTADLSSHWVQTLFDPQFLSQLSWVVPILLVNSGIQVIPNLSSGLSLAIQRMSLALLVIFILRAITVLLAKLNEVYSTLEVARNRPIKGLIQLALILLHAVASILVLAILLDRSPLVFLSGLGAMTAILLLIFRDTILSLVAGVQLTTNDLVRVGDWIEMPQFSADGDVVDIALHSVRIQNFDRTITVIPTHKFLEHSFRNWRGMQESGGRRIKRAIHIDMSTVRFLESGEIESFSRFALLKEYLAEKKRDIEEDNRGLSDCVQVNTRRLTNLGTFRAYLISYLKQHPKIHQHLTFLIRQLDPGPHGLPIEIYVFTNDTQWDAYEGIQADIFDHIIAILPEFGLRVHQLCSGYDWREALQGLRQPQE